MSEIELLIICLELFKLRCRGTVDKSLLKELNYDVLHIARDSVSLDTFKSNFYRGGLSYDKERFKLRKSFLNYLEKFDGMYEFISGKIQNYKLINSMCYKL